MSDVEMQDAHDSEIDDEEEDEIPELKKRVSFSLMIYLK